MTELRKAARDFLVHWDGPHWSDTVKTVEKLRELRAALAEPEQSEPIGVVAETTLDDWPRESGQPYANWFDDAPPVGTNLYTAAPPRREPLSDEQVERLSDGIAVDDYAHDLVRRVEQHHGIGGRDEH